MQCLALRCRASAWAQQCWDVDEKKSSMIASVALVFPLMS